MLLPGYTSFVYFTPLLLLSIITSINIATTMILTTIITGTHIHTHTETIHIQTQLKCYIQSDMFPDVFHIPSKKTGLPVTKSPRTKQHLICNVFLDLLVNAHHLVKVETLFLFTAIYPISSMKAEYSEL